MGSEMCIRDSFPDYENAAKWETLSDEAFSADKDNNHAMRIVHLRRLHPTALGAKEVLDGETR